MPEPGQEETVRVVALDRSFHIQCYKCEVSTRIFFLILCVLLRINLLLGLRSGVVFRSRRSGLLSFG